VKVSIWTLAGEAWQHCNFSYTPVEESDVEVQGNLYSRLR